MSERIPVSDASLRAAFASAHKAAIDAVGGRVAVARALSGLPHAEWPTHAVAIGKAAADMMAGAFDAFGEELVDALVITKHDHGVGLGEYLERARVIESSHPVPDESCLRAGEALWDFVSQAPRDARVLLMMSGGASALAEYLRQGLDAQFMARVNAWLLASGLPIGAMNRVRKRISRLKGGRLAFAVDGRQTLSLMISDVPGDDPRVIGSGPLVEHTLDDIDVSDLDLPPWLREAVREPAALAPHSAFECVTQRVVANPAMAKDAAAQSLRAQGLTVQVHSELLEGDALQTGAAIVEVAQRTPQVVHLWSSETTVQLPPQPGRGGRCQALALAAARAAQGKRQLVVLAAGTDGTDGPGLDAGAIVDAGTVPRGCAAGRDAGDDLAAADAGSFLDASNDLLRTGPTGTNVMDLLMAWSAR